MSLLVLPADLDSHCHVRTVGYLEQYDWKKELATFRYKSTTFEVQTVAYGPFSFVSPCLLHIYAKRASTSSPWQGYQFVPADGINLFQFERYVRAKGTLVAHSTQSQG